MEMKLSRHDEFFCTLRRNGRNDLTCRKISVVEKTHSVYDRRKRMAKEKEKFAGLRAGNILCWVLSDTERIVFSSGHVDHD